MQILHSKILGFAKWLYLITKWKHQLAKSYYQIGKPEKNTIRFKNFLSVLSSETRKSSLKSMNHKKLNNKCTNFVYSKPCENCIKFSVFIKNFFFIKKPNFIKFLYSWLYEKSVFLWGFVFYKKIAFHKKTAL